MKFKSDRQRKAVFARIGGGYNTIRRKVVSSKRNNLTWKKKIVDNISGYVRYDLRKGKYLIDVSLGRRQGYPGSNHVNVFSDDYGGYLLETPRAFPTKTKVNTFIKEAKKRLANGDEGKKVPFTL